MHFHLDFVEPAGYCSVFDAALLDTYIMLYVLSYPITGPYISMVNLPLSVFVHFPL